MAPLRSKLLALTVIVAACQARATPPSRAPTMATRDASLDVARAALPLAPDVTPVPSAPPAPRATETSLSDFDPPAGLWVSPSPDDEWESPPANPWWFGVTMIHPRPVVVGEGLASDAIQGVVQRELRTINGCYERWLMRVPALEGRAVLRFVIGARGRVDAASVEESPRGLERVAACTAFVLRGLTFPEPAGGRVVEVRMPFDFGRRTRRRQR